jgi:O-antigen biosynthesis protein
VEPDPTLLRPSPDTDLALVSVLIRSLDRDHLQEALDSVALQTYPNIEIVVVAATPAHRTLPRRCGPFPLRLVPTDSPLPRSKAANRALDEARGEWLLFLDDDDWLMPDHISRLAEVLRKLPKALAVYTGVSLVDDTGQPRGQVFDLPFDAVRQLAGNLTPIHAVLFSRRVLAGGLRFDEALDRYEDWDFWLQLGRVTPFVHLPGVSAAYRIHDSSGVHTDPGPLSASSLPIYQKWRALWQAGQEGPLMERVWAAHDLELALQDANRAIQRQRITLDEHWATLAQQQATLSLQQSMLTQQLGVLTQQEGTLAQKEGTLAQQQETIAYQQTTIDEQALAVEDLRRQVNNYLATIAIRDDHIAALMNSTSWKITGPLRWISRTLRRPRGQPAQPRDASTMTDLIEKVLRYRRVHGTRKLFGEVATRLSRRVQSPAGPATVPPQQPIVEDSRWISARELVTRRVPQCSALRVFSVPAPATPRVSLVTDSINRGSLYGGVGTAIILACLIAQARGATLRLVTRTERAQPSNLAGVLSTYGLRLDQEVEFAFAHFDDTTEIDAHEGELFLTTSWWTTAATMASVPHESILYLLQEDERMFYPHGDDHLLCSQVLGDARLRFAVNSRLLFDHLVASGLKNVGQNGVAFEPAFPPEVFSRRAVAGGKRRTLAFYARPHNARNLFYFGLELLETAIVRGIVRLDEWDIVLLGKDIPKVRLDGGSYAPQRLENLSWGEYAAFAGTVDLGLCLMYTPHPSYPPFDLSASGAVVVTNRFGIKQDLASYSRNILCGDLELESMLDTLQRGVQLACDEVTRAEHYRANELSSDWKQSLAPVLEVFGKPA